jgi:aspartate/methionine/tyrosine aminotransferase
VITSGEGTAMVDALLCLTNPGNEVILTDPTYAGMMNRVGLVGAVPRLVPWRSSDGEWRLDREALVAAVSDANRVVFLHSAAFPTGWVPTRDEWEAICALCRDRNLRLLYWGAFENVLFDGRTPLVPSGMPDMRDRTVTILGSLEQRMIGWRIAWIVAPGELANDVSRVAIYNDLVPSGFAQGWGARGHPGVGR